MADADTLAPPTTKPDTKPPVKEALKPDAAPIDYDRVGQALGLGGMQKTLQDDRAKIDAMAPGPPKLVPPPVTPPPSDPFQAFGQPAMWLATFGSLLTRHHLTSAIQSAGAVLDSVHKQDDAAVQRAMAEWKVNSENAVKMAKYEQDAYKAAISKYATDARAGEAEMMTLSHAFQNTAAMEVLRTEGPAGLIKMYSKHGTDATLLEKRKLDLDAAFEKRQAEATLEKTWNEANPQATPQQKAAAKLMITEGKDPTTIMTKEFTDPKEVELTHEDGTTEKMMVQQNKLNSAWVTADETRAPVQLHGGQWKIVKEGTAPKPPPPGAADAIEGWKTQYPDAAKNPMALNAAIHTIQTGGVPNETGLPTAKPTTAKPETTAAEVKRDTDTIRNATLARQAQSEGKPLTPEMEKALVDEPGAIAGRDARAAEAGTKTAATTKARTDATPEKPQTTRWESATDTATGESFYHRIGPNGKPQYQTLAGFPMETPGTVARVASSPAAGSAGDENQTRFRDMKKFEQAEGKYTDDSAVWDKVRQQEIAIKENHISPAAAKMIAEQAIAGDYSGLIGWGRSPGIRKDLENALTEEASSRHLTGQDLARLKASYGAFTQGVKAFEAGGKMEQPTRSLSVSVDHLHLLQQTAQALASNNTRFLNAVQNELEREFGLTAAPTFDAIRGIVAAEIEKAVTGGAGAVADREDLKSSLTKNLAPEALLSVISGYEGLMGGQLNGIRSTYQRLQRIEGQTGDNFDKDFLTPRALEVLTGRRASPTVPAAQTEGAMPPVPPAIANATDLHWSAKRKQWRDGSGKIYDADGTLVQ